MVKWKVKFFFRGVLISLSGDILFLVYQILELLIIFKKKIYLIHRRDPTGITRLIFKHRLQASDEMTDFIPQNNATIPDAIT